MSADVLRPGDHFPQRHIGPRESDIRSMLSTLGTQSLDALVEQTVPATILTRPQLDLPPAVGEREAASELEAMAAANAVWRSYIGMGYADCITPPVILRNILENPGWYTQYTPYQAEIAQGRLEALVNFQTMVADLTGLPLTNASLLDEGTAAAEAMTLCHAVTRRKRGVFFVSADCHPQTIAVVRTRAEPQGIEVLVGDAAEARFEALDVFAVLLQVPTTDGRIVDPSAIAERAHAASALVIAATDLLALTLLRPPGEWGADVAIGSAQRLGVPMGFGGPHAGFIATRDAYKRQMPGRIIGVSKDANGEPAYRLALQTREQHIRRDRATSNICTAQVLLAVMAGMYAVYHGPAGLRRIAQRIHGLTVCLQRGLTRLGFELGEVTYFDTLRVPASSSAADTIEAAAAARQINLRRYENGDLGVTLDEVTTLADVDDLLRAFAAAAPVGGEVPDAESQYDETAATYDAPLARTSSFLTHPVFHAYRAEHEFLRYVHRLEARDLSLTTSMIPLGSCTMKLNATTQMLPVTWPAFGRLHPFAPAAQTEGYARLFADLERWLADITGFTAVSLQPNAGSQGEYAGLLVIRARHRHRGEAQRDVCLIPVSAHGTNPASSVMAGMRVVTVACDDHGNIDVEDLKKRAAQHADRLAALMITYPSTHGVFEATVREVCSVVHEHGGLVYMDGANMNAQVGLCRPGEMGADVCHLNLHKTFCIPHGGGGPGMGPIAVTAELAPFLPSHPVRPVAGVDAECAIGPVSAAPYGSPSILPIPWAYMRMMGADGLRRATEIAILNANYMAARLAPHFPVLYTGANGRVAHEFIIDLRPFKASVGVEVDDVAKRLMDYGFHAPTMSWPVPGTMMIEPTESESKAELDRFCDAMIAIRDEIRAIEDGRLPRDDNPLRHAPHTAAIVTADEWTHPYSRQTAAWPGPWQKTHKFWPPVGRVDNAYGDRHLVCSCPPIEAYADGAS